MMVFNKSTKDQANTTEPPEPLSALIPPAVYGPSLLMPVSKESTADTAFNFMKLPPELRLSIYEIILIAPRDGTIRAINLKQGPLTRLDSDASDGVGVCGIPFDCNLCKSLLRSQQHHYCISQRFNAHSDCVTGFLTRNGGEVETSILRCCRLVYTEAMPILYTNSVFNIYLSANNDLSKLLKSLPTFPHWIGYLNITLVKSTNGVANTQTLLALEVLMEKFDNLVPGFSTISFPASPTKQQVGLIYRISRVLCEARDTRGPLEAVMRARFATKTARNAEYIDLEHNICEATGKWKERKIIRQQDIMLRMLEETRYLRKSVH